MATRRNPVNLYPSTEQVDYSTPSSVPAAPPTGPVSGYTDPAPPVVRGAPPVPPNGPIVGPPTPNPPRGASNNDIGRQIMAGGGGVDEILADPSFGGWTRVSNDKIRSPEGSIYDTRFDSEGANTPQWQYISGGPKGPRNDGIKGNDPNGGNYVGPNGVGGAAGPKPTAAGAATGMTDALKKQLMELFQGGGYNNQAVSDRVAGARGDLERQRKSRMATNEAALASRGLIGDGPQASSMNRMEENLYGQYSDAVTGIRADESKLADSRMMQALQIGAGLSTEEARNLVDKFRASTERTNVDNNFTLGKGNLALGNTTASNNYNLGLGRLGLDTDVAGYGLENDRINQIIKLLDQGVSLADIAARGHI